MPAFSNTLVPYATPISMDTVSLNDVFSVLLSLIVSKISLAFYLALFAIFLLVSSSLFYIRISNLFESFSKVIFVSSVASVS